MYAASPPGDSRRFSVDLVGQSFRSFWLTLWNTYSFFVTYANLDGFDPTQTDMAAADRPQLDRWLLSELHTLVRGVTEAYENYDVLGATRPIERFVETLSNWYVRRSRGRFWRSDDSGDKTSAYLTLYETLVTLSKLLAPTMPFLADELYRNLVTSVNADAPDSVHLAQWPEADTSLIDETLSEDMRVVMKLVSLGHAARNSASVKVRQPLAVAAFNVPDDQASVVDSYASLIADELNVKSVSRLDRADDVLRYELNPLPKILGPRFGQHFPTVQKMLRESEQAGDLARTLMADEPITVQVNGEEETLTGEEVEVRRQPAEGYAVAEEAGLIAALDVTLTDALLDEGLAREFIRRVQTLRKEADYNVEDRIATEYVASDRLAGAVTGFADLIQGETLSNALSAVESPSGDVSETYSFDGETLTVGVRRA